MLTRTVLSVHTLHADTYRTVCTYIACWHVPYRLYIHCMLTCTVLSVHTLHADTYCTVCTYTACWHVPYHTVSTYTACWHIPYCLYIHCMLTHTILSVHTLHADMYRTVCTYTACWHYRTVLSVHTLHADMYCASYTHILPCNDCNTDTVNYASVDGWHLGNSESSWSYKTYFFDSCNFRGLHFALSFRFTTKRVLIHKFIISHHIYLYVCWQWLLKFCYQINVTDTFLAADRLVFLILTLTVLPEARSNQIYVLHNVLCSTGCEVLQLVPGVSTATASVLLCGVSQAPLSGWCQHTLIPTFMKSVIFISVINVCRQSYREET
jgi:hypothetical protein